MRVLTDPAETGAVTLALPQDVQAEAYDWPTSCSSRRASGGCAGRCPSPSVLAEAAGLLRGARRPLIVAGGGAIYAEATDALRRFAEATGIPVAETQAGKGSLPYDHPCASARSARPARPPPTRSPARPTSCSASARAGATSRPPRAAFADSGRPLRQPQRGGVDAFKQAGLPLVADARARARGAARALDGWPRPRPQRTRGKLAAEWDATVERAYTLGHGPLPGQSEVIGVVNRVSGPRDVVVCAAGSMPGDLHKLWRTRDPKGYHVEYGYSCMGYEIAGGLGSRWPTPTARSS